MIPLLVGLGAAAIGGAASYAGQKSQERAVRRANEEIEALSAENLAKNKELLDKMYGEQAGIFGPGAALYGKAWDEYANSAGYTPGQYSYQGNIEDFYSPATQMRINTAMNAIQNSRANAGGMFSSDTFNEMNAKAQLMASEEYDKAYSRYMQDRALNLNEWNVNQDQQYKAWQSQIDKNKTLLSMADADRRALAQAAGDYYTNLINANNAALSTTAGISVANANATANPYNSIGTGIGMGLGAASLFSK